LNFRLGTIPVRVRPEFFILPAVFGLQEAQAGRPERAVIWLLIVFVSVLIHELGHATAMRVFGFPPRIELHMMGGFTSWPDGARPNDKQKLFVTLCGPGIELLAAVAVMFGTSLLDLPPLAAWARTTFVWVNLYWALINLLPILPWDGGLVLDSIVSLITKRPRSPLVGAVSFLFGALAVVYAFFTLEKGAIVLRETPFLMIVYLGGIGMWKGWMRWNGTEPGHLPPEAEVAWNLSEKGEHQKAEALLVQALAAAKEPAVRAHLLEVLAWVRLSANDAAGAEKALREMGPDAQRTSPELRARLAAHRQEPHRVVELLVPLASILRLRPEAWPLLVSAMEDDKQRDEVIVSAMARLALSPAEQQIAAAAAEKLFHGGHIEAALVMCVRAFEVCKGPLFAFNAACCLCRLGRVDEGLEWLKKAVSAGYTSQVPLDDDPDLAPLRDHPGFAALKDAALKAG
jgi:Zn-dependent protease